MRSIMEVFCIFCFFRFISWIPTVSGCTTRGLMPLRDQAYMPFCCHPSQVDLHCPKGARCENDTYYGHGLICCGPVNMVWDAYGGNYQKAAYDACGRDKMHKFTTPTPSDSWPRWPRWTSKNDTHYASMPPVWTDGRDGPLVAPIVVGEYNEAVGKFVEGENGFWAAASVTLVRDGPCTILVDTGSTSDADTIRQGLSAYGLSLEDIQYVVITQGTPEHVGNQNLFTRSKIFYAWVVIDFDHFLLTDLGKSDMVRLCANTELQLTPGVTKDAISLFVRNVSGYGTVAVVGDVFLYDHSCDFMPKQFAALIWDMQALVQSREKVLCQADWIVPGHGSKFSAVAKSPGSRCKPNGYSRSEKVQLPPMEPFPVLKENKIEKFRLKKKN